VAFFALSYNFAIAAPLRISASTDPALRANLAV
jgi:hypothetical protein